MGHTRTYVRYFTEDAVAPLTALLDELADDWRRRLEYIDGDARCAGNERIEAARLALLRLTDRVPE